jgi:hypothetical protein
LTHDTDGVRVLSRVEGSAVSFDGAEDFVGTVVAVYGGGRCLELGSETGCLLLCLGIGISCFLQDSRDSFAIDLVILQEALVDQDFADRPDFLLYEIFKLRRKVVLDAIY